MKKKIYNDQYLDLRDKYIEHLIGAILFLVILSAFFAVGNYMLYRQLKTDSYIATEATVVDYVLRYERDTHDHSHMDVPTYYNVVEYEIDGTAYRKTQDTPASTYKAPVEDIGNVITIYVSPNDPKDVIFRTSTHIILIVASYVVSVVGYALCVFILRKAVRFKKEMKKYLTKTEITNSQSV